MATGRRRAARSVPDRRWYRTLDDEGVASETWRDPFVFKDPAGDGWHMLITARVTHAPRLHDGVLAHARSADMLTWAVQPPLLSQPALDSSRSLRSASSTVSHCSCSLAIPRSSAPSRPRDSARTARGTSSVRLPPARGISPKPVPSRATRSCPPPPSSSSGPGSGHSSGPQPGARGNPVVRGPGSDPRGVTRGRPTATGLAASAAESLKSRYRCRRQRPVGQRVTRLGVEEMELRGVKPQLRLIAASCSCSADSDGPRP